MIVETYTVYHSYFNALPFLKKCQMKKKQLKTWQETFSVCLILNIFWDRLIIEVAHSFTSTYNFLNSGIIMF